MDAKPVTARKVKCCGNCMCSVVTRTTYPNFPFGGSTSSELKCAAKVDKISSDSLCKLHVRKFERLSMPDVYEVAKLLEHKPPMTERQVLDEYYEAYVIKHRWYCATYHVKDEELLSKKFIVDYLKKTQACKQIGFILACNNRKMIA